MAGRFWLMLQEPRRVPERKGPWPMADTLKILREFMAARPGAYITILTVDEEGVPWVQHGPEWLEMMDGRSRSVVRRHNRSVLSAHVARHAEEPA